MTQPPETLALIEALLAEGDEGMHRWETVRPEPPGLLRCSKCGAEAGRCHDPRAIGACPL